MAKAKERFLLALSAFVITFTLFLVIDLQLDLGYSGHHIVPSHGKVKFGDDISKQTAYNNFRRRFLQKVNSVAESSGKSGNLTFLDSLRHVEEESTEKPTFLDNLAVRDNFADLVEFVRNGEGVELEDSVIKVTNENHKDSVKLWRLREKLCT